LYELLLETEDWDGMKIGAAMEVRPVTILSLGGPTTFTLVMPDFIGFL
jgi:hypothetical protein